MARLLDLGEAIELHCDLVNRYGGQSGIRHTAALRGAVGQRDTGDLYDIAAGYAFDFATARPFPESNARAGLVAALVFLDLNGVTVGANDDDFVRVVTRIKNRSVGPKKLAKFFRERAGRQAPPPSTEPSAPPASDSASESPAPAPAPAPEPEPDSEPAESVPDSGTGDPSTESPASGNGERESGHRAPESRPGDRPTSSTSVAAAMAETAAEIEAARDEPAADPIDTAPPAPAPTPDPDAPMGPGAGETKERQTSVRELADALADLEDDPEES